MQGALSWGSMCCMLHMQWTIKITKMAVDVAPVVLCVPQQAPAPASAPSPTPFAAPIGVVILVRVRALL